MKSLAAKEHKKVNIEFIEIKRNNMMQEYFEIGQIVNTFGIKGMVKVKSFYR